jgi:serine/threonine protein kinase
LGRSKSAVPQGGGRTDITMTTPQVATPTTSSVLTAAAKFAPLTFLKELVNQGFIPLDDLKHIAPSIRGDLLRCSTSEELLSNLVDWRLLTPFQAHRLIAGATFGMVLGNYRLLDRLGSGSMGVVYRGEHTALRTPVAVKVLPNNGDQDGRVLNRFLNEIRSIARLRHKHVVAAIDLGGATCPDDRGTVLHYFVMEYLRGQDLERMVHKRGPLAIADACRWTAQIASALAEAHRHKLVHRDIKPSNVLITEDGSAKLLDFGLAYRRNVDQNTTGHIVGTLDYMAPEQFENPYAVDVRADLYSLGGVLYWCLTGKKPFPSAGNDIYDFSQRLFLPPPSPRKLRPEVPEALDTVVRRLLQLNPANRINSPDDVQQILDAVINLPKA